MMPLYLISADYREEACQLAAEHGLPPVGWVFVSLQDKMRRRQTLAGRAGLTPEQLIGFFYAYEIEQLTKPL